MAKINLEKYRGIPNLKIELQGAPLIDIAYQKKWQIPEKIIIKAAVCGSLFTKMQNPNQPWSTDEIKKESLESVEAGAASVHIHVRNEWGIPTGDKKIFKKVIDPLRKKYKSNVVIDGCALFGRDFLHTLEPVIEGLFEICPVNTTATYIGDVSFVIPPKTMQAQVDICQQLGVKPQIAVYNMGDIDNAKRHLIDTKIIKKPYYWIIVPNLPGCSPMPDPFKMAHNLINFVKLIYEIDKESIIMVCSSGRASNYLSTMAILLGLHLRIGMEDTIFRYPHKDDLIKNNKEVVISTIKIAEELGRMPVSAKGYRELVGIKYKHKV